ncbi:MAG: hypothetical protein EOO01_36040, partial [Chitinophagaceae bacterium]
MKYLVAFVIFVFALFPASAQQSAGPDFERITDYRKKMDSLKAYCNILLGADSAKGDNFPQALVYGQLGLRMAKKDDHRALAQFSMITGVSHYNRASFDSAAFYMKMSAR